MDKKMNANKIGRLKQELDGLRRKLDLADAEVKALDGKRANAQRAVSMLEKNPFNREKIENAQKELQNQKTDYNSVSANYYRIFEEIRQKTIEITQEQNNINMDSRRDFRR